MSAFIVRDVTINKIVSFLQLKAMGDPYYQPNRIVSSAGYAACNDGEAARLARDLFALNVRAVNHRYPDSAAQFRPLDYLYQFTITTSRMAALKALECLRYQCSEGDIPETKLYQLMTELIHELAVDIVRDSKEWQQADWG